MKLICITPQEDNESIIYLKPDTALLRNNDAFYMPEFSHNITAQPALVIKIKKMGKKIAERFAHRYYEEITVGYNFTAQDILQQNIEKQRPWDNATGFDYSAPIGQCIIKDDNAILTFISENNKTTKKASEINVNQFISEASHKFTLKIGDFIYIMLSSEKKQLQPGQTLTAQINDQPLLKCEIK